MDRSLILGESDGLGVALAWESDRRGVNPILCRQWVLSFPAEFLPPLVKLVNFEMTRPSSFVLALEFAKRKDVRYVFWVAGRDLKAPLKGVNSKDIDLMAATHFVGPMKFFSGFQRNRKAPYHLVIIASTSSRLLKENESLYCALNSAKQSFGRQFAKELAKDLPGSKVTVANLDAVRFLKKKDPDAQYFMRPTDVAIEIWQQVLTQTKIFEEMQIVKNPDGSLRVEYGPRMPEILPT
jgi:NAD(P)-dependent dehydrogenase (short-subunit alcohol dehydrogenase family)